MPDPIEPNPDPIQSSRWQREPPEEDGWYVAIEDHGDQVVLELETDEKGDRWLEDAHNLDVLCDRPIRWWLVPGIDLPPRPEEEP